MATPDTDVLTLGGEFAVKLQAAADAGKALAEATEEHDCLFDGVISVCEHAADFLRDCLLHYAEISAEHELGCDGC